METGKLQNMRWRVNFFKDLVGSDGQSSSRLQQSVEISGVENVNRAVDQAKRRYERLCRVPLWSLYADRLELDPGPAHIVSIALAEWIRRTLDWLDPTRVHGPFAGVQC
jgi:hypothetical protein